MNPESPQIENQEQKKEFEIDYQPFDPRVELEKVRTEKDKQTKREKLKEYKEELIKQKQGIAQVQVGLEKQIRKNPDLNQTELIKTVYAKALEFRLSENQLKLFKETLDKYVKKHQAIREMREKHPSDKKLFERCFGKYPEGKIEIIETPITLCFRCHNIKDYTWIRERKFFEPEEDIEITKKEIKSAKTTTGIAIYECLTPSLAGVVTVENATGILNKISNSKATLKHEEQHAIKRLFEEQQLTSNIATEFKKTKSLKHLPAYLRFLRKDLYDPQAKNEILAYYKESSESLLGIKMALFKPKKRRGLYDYFNEDKEWLDAKLGKNLGVDIYKKNQEKINKVLKNVFADEYKQDVKKAIGAIKKLKKIGKSRNEIISLLITEPLSRWEKLVNRIKETKRPSKKKKLWKIKIHK